MPLGAFLQVMGLLELESQFLGTKVFADVRQVLFDLAGMLTAYACTTVLVGEYTVADVKSFLADHGVEVRR